MATIRPFRGTRYNPEKSGDISLNVCPPFDAITPALQKDLYDRSEYNIVRLELARRGLVKDPYESAAETQRRWLESGVLTRDNEPSVYVTEETFAYNGGKAWRRGLVAAVHLEEYEQGVILPHEGTRTEWVADRVRLMSAVKFAYSPLLVTFRDDLRSSVGSILRAVAGGEPTVDIAPPDMPELRMWRVTDPGTIDVLTRAMDDSQLFIADGHHRYEAALRYRAGIRAQREVAPDELINYRMMLMVSVDEPGLITRGYHRTIENASDEELRSLRSLLISQCDVEEVALPMDDPQGAAAALTRKLGDRQGREVKFGVLGMEAGKAHVATLTQVSEGGTELERSEYSQVHDLFLNRVFPGGRQEESVNFQHDLVRVLAAVADGSAKMAFVMRPAPMSEFISIVTRGWRLPPKATNFYPKPPAGFVMQSLEGRL